MENTKWYNEFKEWIGKIGSREGDYFLPYHFLDTLTDDERDEVETIMYEVFKSKGNGVSYFARYMRYLKNYDGIAALKWFLDEYPLSAGMANREKTARADIRSYVAAALYEATLDAKYIDMMMDLYRITGKFTIISRMRNCTPSEALFDALVSIYVNDEETHSRSIASDGMLHCKGYIGDMSSYLNPNEDQLKLGRLLYFAKDVNERETLAEKLRANQPLIEGIPVPEPLV